MLLGALLRGGEGDRGRGRQAGRRRPDQRLRTPEPVSAEISATDHAPRRPAPPTSAATSRGPSSRAREIGASSSQNPSAAEASTGPNSRLARPARRATAAANAAQGRTVRADRQDAVLHWATDALGLEDDVDDHRADHQRGDHRDVRVAERLEQVPGGPAARASP